MAFSSAVYTDEWALIRPAVEKVTPTAAYAAPSPTFTRCAAGPRMPTRCEGDATWTTTRRRRSEEFRAVWRVFGGLGVQHGSVPPAVVDESRGRGEKPGTEVWGV